MADEPKDDRNVWTAAETIEVMARAREMGCLEFEMLPSGPKFRFQKREEVPASRRNRSDDD